MDSLSGADADAYVASLRALLAVARPSAHFPDPRRLDAFLSFLGPMGSEGTRSTLLLDARSGLPASQELARLLADRELAPRLLRGSDRKDARRAAYLRRLLAAELPRLSDLAVTLVAHQGRRRRFRVVRDLVDVPTGCYVRFTFLFSQRGDRPIALQRGDLAQPSAAFRREAERCAGGDAEQALLLLTSLDGVDEVEEVVRGVLGPLTPPAIPVRGPLADVLASAPGQVLHLALERAGSGVGADRCVDPWSRLYRDVLDESSRQALEHRRSSLIYRVAKERRLACTPPLEEPLAKALARAGTPLVVRAR